MQYNTKRKPLSKSDRETIYAKYNGHCAYCGAEIKIGQMQADHLIPMMFYETYLTQGIDIDSLENLMPSCRSCNNYKHSLTIEKFREAVARFTDVLLRDNVTYRNAVRFGQIKPTPHPVIFYFEKEADHAE